MELVIVQRNRIVIELPREQYLQSRPQPVHLQLPPELALITADAIHDATNILKLLPELLLHSDARAAVEQRILVEVIRERLDYIKQIPQSVLDVFVVRRVAREEVVRLQKLVGLGDGAQLD